MTDKPTGENEVQTNASIQTETGAKNFLYLPVYPVAVMLCIGLSLGVLSVMGFYSIGLALDPGLPACVIFGLVSALLLYLSYDLIRIAFLPLSLDGLEFLGKFRFNEPGEAILRSVAKKKNTIRVIDLSMALRAHFHHENETKQKELDHLHKEAMNRFKTGS